MKQKFSLLLALGILSTGAFAQSNTSESSLDKKATAVGIHFNAVDFKTPVTFKDAGTPRNFYGLKVITQVNGVLMYPQVLVFK